MTNLEIADALIEQAMEAFDENVIIAMQYKKPAPSPTSTPSSTSTMSKPGFTPPSGAGISSTGSGSSLPSSLKTRKPNLVSTQ